MACARPRCKTLCLLLTAGMLVTLLHSILSDIQVENAMAASTECADGIDNDFDGTIDYPQDAECLSLHDDSEGPTGRGVFLSVSDGLQTVKQGGHITYTVSLQSERNEQKNVDVHFFIPHQTNLLSASNAGRREGDYIVWRNVTIYPKRARQLYVHVEVKPRTTIDLLVVAEVTAGGQKDTDTTRVIAGDALNENVIKLSVTDGKAYAEPNESLTYTIRVDNTNGGTKKYQLRSNLPTTLEFTNASGNPYRQQRVVIWPKTEILAGEIHEYFLQGTVERGSVDGTPLQMRVSTAETFASDTTTVHTGLLDSAFSVQVSDGYDAVIVGDTVTYAILVRNRTNRLATEIDVNNALPSYTEFVAATEGGFWTGTNIRWQGLTISPHGERILHVKARIRKDAPLGEVLKNRVEVRGNVAVDTSRIASEIAYTGNGPLETARSPIVLRKTASRSEARPGDTLQYSIYLRNNTNGILSNILVQDRMDSQYMQVLGSSFGSMDQDRLTWEIPLLQPGEEWTVQYTVQVSPHVPHGSVMNNIVSVTGDSMETVSLTERVSIGTTNIITKLPPAGVGFGTVFVLLIGILGAVQTVTQRRGVLL